MPHPLCPTASGWRGQSERFLLGRSLIWRHLHPAVGGNHRSDRPRWRRANRHERVKWLQVTLKQPWRRRDASSSLSSLQHQSYFRCFVASSRFSLFFLNKRNQQQLPSVCYFISWSQQEADADTSAVADTHTHTQTGFWGSFQPAESLRNALQNSNLLSHCRHGARSSVIPLISCIVGTRAEF